MSPGEVIGEVYVVVRRLGSGGMGSVYLARDRKLDRYVALKLLHAELAGHEEHIGRFQREGRAMSRIVHPNVAGIYAIGRHGEHLFIAMEFVEGETLDELLRERERLPLPLAVSILRQIANGLAEAHALDIVHRDIKPSNILLRRLASGALLAKVVDFGLARSFDEDAEGDASGSMLTMPHTAIGTPSYMAPEQVQGLAIDGRADQYALGVVLYQMLTGELPFAGRTVMDVFHKHLKAPIPELPSTSDWPAGLQAELARALAKEAADRHASIVAFAGAIERAAQLGDEGSASERAPCGVCTHKLRPGDRFCPSCGAATPAPECPACGAVRVGERYACVECGTSLLPAARGAAPEQGLPETTALVLCARLVGDSGAQAEFAATFTATMERERGRAIAVLGDQAVAVFGLGGMISHDAESAVDAALALAEPDRLGLDAEAAVAVGLDLGAVSTLGPGVAWGSALVVGRAVQSARRAARVAEPGAVVVGERAYREVRGAYDAAELQPGLRRVLSRRETRVSLSKGWSVHGGDVPLVGRQLELMQLERAARTVARKGQLLAVPIIGSPGVGKSRLVGELLRRLLDDGKTRWEVDVGRCRPGDLVPAYGPFSEMMQARLSVSELPRSADLRARLETLPGVPVAVPGVNTSSAAALSRLLGMETLADATRAPRPATDSERRIAFDAFGGYVAARCESEPLVMVVEDLQWAKPNAVELLSHVVERCDGMSVLLVLPVRSDRAEGVLEKLPLPPARTIAVTLEPLEEEETEELLGLLLEGADVPEEVAATVQTFSGGVPLQIEEALDALIDAGVYVRREGEWHLEHEALSALELTRPLAEVVQQRVGRMAPAQREIALAVSVCEHDVPRSLIGHLIGRPAPEYDIVGLVDAGVLAEVRRGLFGGEREFEIRQDVIRQIISTLVPEDQRRAFHARAAEWLGAWDGRRPPGFSGMLAHHLLGAGDTPRAVRSLLKAAAQATRSYANVDAFQAFGAALDAARRWRTEAPSDVAANASFVEAAIGRAVLGLRVGEADAALAAARSAQAAAQAGGRAHEGELARALCLEGDALESVGRYEQALQAFAAAARVVMPGDPDSGLAIYAGGRRAMTLLKAGRPDEAEVVAREVLEESDEYAVDEDLHRGLGSIHGVLGHLELRRGRFESASHHHTTARNHRLLAEDATGAAMAAVSIGNVAYGSGDLDSARGAYQEALEECRRIGFVRGEAVARTNLGAVLLELERHDEALIELRGSVGLLERLGARSELVEALRLLATTARDLGEGEEARGAADKALEVARELGEPSGIEAIEALLKSL